MGLKLQDLVVGVIFFSLIITGFTLYLGEIGLSYNVEVEEEFEATYNKINATLSLTSAIQDKTETAEVDKDDSISSAFKNALDAVRALTTGVTLISDLLESGLTNDLGLHPSFATGIKIALSVILAFLIIAFVRGSLGGIS